MLQNFRKNIFTVVQRNKETKINPTKDVTVYCHIIVPKSLVGFLRIRIEHKKLPDKFKNGF